MIDTALTKAENQMLGLSEICHDYVETDRLEMDFTAWVCIDHYSPEQKRRLEAELELSHKLQKALLPQHMPEIPGLQVAAFSQPAEIVGGDYFDFFRFRDDGYGFVIANVLVLYTEGITEAINAAREEFGENRLADFTRKKADLRSKEFIKELRLVLNAFAGGQTHHDDVTILAGKVER
ncbi:MAG: SpoIIE family protein phosphatase [candidate division KSB1 bacterium]|nr:SpoIIE family protein phosphatase [candidate division KSB1 bacterium]MDZ7407024.1 SpoIIE family protein phosphatase [candidate division KSB1 bacterium]